MMTEFKLHPKEEITNAAYFEYQPEYQPDTRIGHGAFGIVWYVMGKKISSYWADRKFTLYM